ncbi:MAG: BatD family protein [Candidatus Protochlamydia sp.]|nr:BatD family protein [Candidatus Protochlamydia sp.]
MVKHCVIFFFLFIPALYSGEFNAAVNRNQINLGENVILNLTLKGAAVKEAPSFNALKKSFFVNSQNQSSSTVIVNGKVSSSMIWSLTLTPQKEGDAFIPAISIETTEGTLSSEPITIRVVKGAGPNDTDSNGLILTAEMSNGKPYKNEPFILTFRLTSKENLANIQMHKLAIEEAIVEANGEPKIYEKIVDGVRVGVLELSYVITPLKAGLLKIPSIFIRGGIVVKRTAQSPSSFFDDDFDFPFMQGFDRLKPFSVASEETILDVQPAIAGIVPWLPAKELKIEEVRDGSSFQAGEPFTRSFKITAVGVKSSQLPHLNNLQVDGPSFKIYADKPETGEELRGGEIESFRNEHYTLIPQQAGDLTLPEIAVIWWDTIKKEKRATIIPSKTIHVQPATTPQRSSFPMKEAATDQSEPPVIITERDPKFYVIIAGLALLLFGALIWGISLQKKIGRLTEKPEEVVEKNSEKIISTKKKKNEGDKREKLPDLNPT